MSEQASAKVQSPELARAFGRVLPVRYTHRRTHTRSSEVEAQTSALVLVTRVIEPSEGVSSDGAVVLAWVLNRGRNADRKN